MSGFWKWSLFFGFFNLGLGLLAVCVFQDLCVRHDFFLDVAESALNAEVRH